MALRAFIAIQLSGELKRLIGDLQGELKRKAPALRGLGWVRPDSMHLTLKFLGDIEESQTESLKEMLKAVGHRYRPFSLEARGLGAFPTPQRARVLWLGLAGVAEDEQLLSTLQAEIEEGAEQLGFLREARSFTPHLTLARVRERSAVPALTTLLPGYESRLVGAVSAVSVTLVRSELKPSGAFYTTLVEVPLGVPV
jgi:2'-5' RNA ligase